MEFDEFVALILEDDSKEIREDLHVNNCELPPGLYNGYRYGYCIEINGICYETKLGVRCSKEHCGGLSDIIVTDDHAVFQIHKKIY